jgi:thiamine biosynthesis protein ThiI
MGDIMHEIIDNIPSRFTCIICKRMMYRIACGLAMIKKADGIVTGESLGQVASQTLANLTVLDEVSPFPVYRPLISCEKNDIIALARKIGTYDLSIVKTHGCSVVPSKPATRSRLEIIRNLEKDLDVDSLISQSLSKLTVIPI